MRDSFWAQDGLGTFEKRTPEVFTYGICLLCKSTYIFGLLFCARYPYNNLNYQDLNYQVRENETKNFSCDQIYILLWPITKDAEQSIVQSKLEVITRRAGKLERASHD